MSPESLQGGVAVLDAAARAPLGCDMRFRALLQLEGDGLGPLARLLGTDPNVGALLAGSLDRVELAIGGRTVALTCERSGTVVLLRAMDVTTDVELGALLDAASRFDALLRLSEGMAHDARNPLNAIALNVEVLGEKLKSGGPELRAAVDKYLKAIKEQVSRADRIIREYVGFVRPEHGRSAETDLAELVHRAVEVCRHDARKRGVRVDARLTNVAVTANSSDLSQAILQLVMHGIDASSGGTLQIAVERHGQEAVLQLHEELAAAPAANGASPATRRIPMSALEHLLGKLRANLLSRPLERGGELVVRFPAA